MSGIESWWSVNSTEESREYSRNALNILMFNMKNYLANKDDGNAEMLVASNYARKAINITQTTAAHAMSYKLTLLYGIPHGRAVFLCLPSIKNNPLELTEDMIRSLYSDIIKKYQ